MFMKLETVYHVYPNYIVTVQGYAAVMLLTCVSLP